MTVPCVLRSLRLLDLLAVLLVTPGSTAWTAAGGWWTSGRRTPVPVTTMA